MNDHSPSSQKSANQLEHTFFEIPVLHYSTILTRRQPYNRTPDNQTVDNRTLGTPGTIGTIGEMDNQTSREPDNKTGQPDTRHPTPDTDRAAGQMDSRTSDTGHRTPDTSVLVAWYPGALLSCCRAVMLNQCFGAPVPPCLGALGAFCPLLLPLPFCPLVHVLFYHFALLPFCPFALVPF